MPVYDPGMEEMVIEVWSDVVCSWCYIGKRHLEQAMRGVPEGERLTVRYRSFELDPTIAPDAGPADDELARRRGITLEQAREMHAQTEHQGAELGISFDFRRARRGNTFDAHRVLQLARDHGCQPAVKERLLATYFSEGGAIGDRATLATAAAKAGLDYDQVAEMLAGDRYAAEVRTDEREAAELGINVVPFFVIDRRFGLAGAQPPELLRQAIEQAWSDRREAG